PRHVLPPFPPRRSSDLIVVDDRAGRDRQRGERRARAARRPHHGAADDTRPPVALAPRGEGEEGLVKPPKFDYHAPKTVDEALALDRKSTRLNSSHQIIS